MFNTGSWQTITKSVVEFADSGTELANSTTDSAANPAENQPLGTGLKHNDV